MQAAEKAGNKEKALEFREKFVECIVYTVQSLVSAKRLDEAEELVKRGLEAAKAYGIEELGFHMELNRKRIEAIRAARAQTR